MADVSAQCATSRMCGTNRRRRSRSSGSKSRRATRSPNTPVTASAPSDARSLAATASIHVWASAASSSTPRRAATAVASSLPGPGGAPLMPSCPCGPAHRVSLATRPTACQCMAVSETADRFRSVADGFSERAGAVPDGGWDAPAPCEGWVARDVVAHLVDWVPAFFFEQWNVEVLPRPGVDRDPAGAWESVRGTIQRALDDPSVAGREADTPLGRQSFEAAIAAIVIGDVLVHTWDVARACGLDERLDPAEVHVLVTEMDGMGEAMVASGHYGPPVEVPGDADEQTRMLALTGRTP